MLCCSIDASDFFFNGFMVPFIDTLVSFKTKIVFSFRIHLKTVKTGAGLLPQVTFSGHQIIIFSAKGERLKTNVKIIESSVLTFSKLVLFLVFFLNLTPRERY